MVISYTFDQFCTVITHKENSYVLRTRLQTDSYSTSCDQWISKFSAETKTNWIVNKTFPHKERYLYRKDFVCQHSSKHKSTNNKTTRIRDKNCTASIKMIIKKNTSNTRRKDKYIRDGLNCEIKVHFEHSHKIDNAEAYSYLRVSKSVQDEFIRYFSKGMTPSVAKNFHEVKLTTNNNEEDLDLIKLLADAQINPTERQVIQIFDSWRSSNYGDRTASGIIEVMQTKKMLYLEAGGLVEIEESPLCICIVTPLMKRAHGMPFSKDIVFVDSSSSCDQSNSCVTFLFGSSKVGGIPLAVIIHKHLTKESYVQAFSLLQKCLGDIGFYGQKHPLVFMTDDSYAERQALKQVFPKSTLLLCAFHVCQALWRWLWETKHKINQFERQSLMTKFRDVLFEFYEENALLQMEELCNHSNKLFSEHMVKLKNRIKEWAICYRKELNIHGQNTNNIVEASIRIFKDIVLERCKAFNAAALVDFVFEVLENYHTRRLIKFVSYRVSKPTLEYQSFCKKAKNLKVTSVNESQFHVYSSTDDQLVYTVNFKNDYQYCDCPAGQGGAYCKHICAIYLSNIIMSNSPKLSHEDRVSLATLAVGKSFDYDFLKTMDLDNNSETSVSIDSNQYSDIINKENEIENNNQTNNSATLTENVSINMELELESLQTEVDRIKTLASENNSTFVLKSIKNLKNQFQRITSISDLADVTNHFMRHGKLIGTQPTSRSRRKTSISSGVKRLQAGRPSNVEKNMKIKRQRKRCLALNINENVPNSKTH